MTLAGRYSGQFATRVIRQRYAARAKRMWVPTVTACRKGNWERLKQAIRAKEGEVAR
jgi:hypothetical protein